MFLYRLLSLLFLPLLYLYLLLRLANGKEDFSRFKERFGFAGKKRPKGDLFWVHCVSVGESNSAISLIEKVLEDNLKVNILFTSTTTTSASQIASKMQHHSRVIHQFLPIDDIISVRRFLKYWHPKLAIFVESEIWPNLINEASRKNIKLALINARISQRSATRWLKLHKMGFNILKNFQISFAQSLRDQERLIELGLKDSKFIGNIKSCAQTLKFNDEELISLKKQIGSRKFWLAASTHKGEEEIIIRTHKKLQKYFPDILTIIAIRHPKRVGEVMKIIPDNLKYSVRSKNEKITKDKGLYIVDTLGELGLFYKLSDVSLIAGSLKDNIGGHNPFEALKLGCVVISGDNVANFLQVYTELTSSKSCILVKNEEELLFYLLRLLKDKTFLNDFKENWNSIEEGNDNMLVNISAELIRLAKKKITYKI